MSLEILRLNALQGYKREISSNKFLGKNIMKGKKKKGKKKKKGENREKRSEKGEEI